MILRIVVLAALATIGYFAFVRRNRLSADLLPRTSAWILLALLFVALVLDFLFFTGFYASDDIHYIGGAAAVAGDGEFIPELGNVRLGITLPSAFAYWITGGSVSAIPWFHVGYHLALVIVAYVLGRLLHGERAGLIAAALAAINPLYYVYAGAVLPDNATAVWLGASMIALIVTQRRAAPGTHLTSWNRDRFTGYLIAGMLLGVCYMCKETALIMTIPAAVLIMTAPGFRSLLWIQNGAILALGLAVVIAFDFVALRVVTGEWIFRLGLLSDAEGLLIKDMQAQGVTPFERMSHAHSRLEPWIPITMWLLLAGTVAYSFLRGRSVGLATYFWFPIVYLTIGSTSFTSYVPPAIQARYYSVVVLPAAVMTGAVISYLMQRWQDSSHGPAWIRRFGPRLALVGLLVIVGARELRSSLPSAGTLYRAGEVRAFAAALEIAGERYREYPLVLSSYYRGRMIPLVAHRPKLLAAARPAPPYVYVEMIETLDAGGLAALQSPTQQAKPLLEVLPPLNRGAILVDALRRVFSVKAKPRMRHGKRTRGAALVLVTPRVAPPTPAPPPR